MQQVKLHPSNFAQHVSCSTVNMAEEKHVLNHPNHPEHWLTFFKNKSGFTCGGCGKGGHGNGYECAVCDFDLHVSCASNSRAKIRVILHPIDPGHCLSYAQYPHGFTCNDCGKEGDEDGYGCVACDLDLHESCVTIEMADEKPIKHPSHPAHSLSFFKGKEVFRCNGCGEEGSGNGYGCDMCNFDMHISCAAAKVKLTEQTRPSGKKHILRYARYPEGFVCHCCGKGGSRSGYGCVSCNFDMHISCATLNMAEQKPIEHPKHSWHNLSYVRYPRGYQCNECRGDMHGNGYRCAACDYDLHIGCMNAPRKRAQRAATGTIQGAFANLALADSNKLV